MRFTGSTGFQRRQPVLRGSVALRIALLPFFQSFFVLWIGKKTGPRFYLIAKIRFHGKVNR